MNPGRQVWLLVDYRIVRQSPACMFSTMLTSCVTLAQFV